MKVIVISSHDPDVHPGMIGDAVPFCEGDSENFRVTLNITRKSVFPFLEKSATIFMHKSEIKFVKPQIPI